MSAPLDTEMPARIPHPDRDSAVKIVLAKGYSAFCLRTMKQRSAGEEAYVLPKTLEQHPGMRDRGEITYSRDLMEPEDKPLPDGVPVFGAGSSSEQPAKVENPFGDPVKVKGKAGDK